MYVTTNLIKIAVILIYFIKETFRFKQNSIADIQNKMGKIKCRLHESFSNKIISLNY